MRYLLTIFVLCAAVAAQVSNPGSTANLPGVTSDGSNGLNVTVTNLATSVLLGRDTRIMGNGNSNEIAIGYQATGVGTNTATLGNTAVTLTQLRGALSGSITTLQMTSATEGGCAGVTDLTVDHNSARFVGSASYTFVTADVGGVVDVTAGTGWTPGVYTIVELSSGKAGLDRSPAAKDTASGTASVNRGRITFVKGGAGAADTLRICRKDATNTYAWTALY